MLKANARPTANSKAQAKPTARTEGRKEAKGKLKDASSMPRVKSLVHLYIGRSYQSELFLRAVALSREKSSDLGIPTSKILEVVA